MKPKRLPRLWCALQGLLPLDACEAAQRAELAWPREELVGAGQANARRDAGAVGKISQSGAVFAAEGAPQPKWRRQVTDAAS